MKYIIWGAGLYCKEKLRYWNSENKIVAIVERYKTTFDGRETILPNELDKYKYDYIVIMSSRYLEIIPELIERGVDHKKIIPGILVRPLIGDELELITNLSKIYVLKDGTLNYVFNKQHSINISEKSDWKKVKKVICEDDNANYIKRLACGPVGKLFGHNRGGSICRYYIEKFLYSNKSFFRGNILEIGDRNYTEKYGGNDYTSYLLRFNMDDENDKYSFCGDLTTGKGLQENFFDCIVLTQVIDFIYDVSAALDNSIKALKKNGVLLLTVSGITPISRSDMDRYGHYWNFTDASIKKLLHRSDVEYRIQTYGNCKAACAFLQGMSYKELEKEELDYHDEDFQVVISAMIKRIK